MRSPRQMKKHATLSSAGAMARRSIVRAPVRKALAMLLLAGALLPGASRAQALSVQVPHGLAGSAAWLENIALGIDVWLVAHENARRTLLLGRCTAFDPRFPERPAPAMVTASTEVFRWMTGEGHTDLPPEPYSVALRNVLPVLATHVFNADELASWDAVRGSAQIRRGLALHEVEVALVKASDAIVDINSGRYWGWPLARVGRLADAQGLRAEVDATLETLVPGAAARLRNISLVPAETPADEPLLRAVSQAGETLAPRFFEQLTPADHEAYERVARIEVVRRWLTLTQALPRFALSHVSDMVRDNPMPNAAADFCSRMDLPACRPGEAVEAAITAYLLAFGSALRSDTTVDAARLIVRKLPSSGCS